MSSQAQRITPMEAARQANAVYVVTLPHVRTGIIKRSNSNGTYELKTRTFKIKRTLATDKVEKAEPVEITVFNDADDEMARVGLYYKQSGTMKFPIVKQLTEAEPEGEEAALLVRRSEIPDVFSAVANWGLVSVDSVGDVKKLAVPAYRSEPGVPSTSAIPARSKK